MLRLRIISDQRRSLAERSSATFTVAAGVNTGGVSTTVNLNGFTNEGIGAITIGAGAGRRLG